MRRWLAILLIVLGTITSVSGVLIARVFYSWSILPMMEVTLWDGVIVFSIVAAIGLAAVALGIRSLLVRRTEDVHRSHRDGRTLGAINNQGAGH